MNGNAAYKDPSSHPFMETGAAVDAKRRRVKCNGRIVHLNPMEFSLMMTFLCHPNTVLSRMQLLNEVWQTDFLGASRTVDMHVSTLRKKMGWGDRIVSVRKVGYRLMAGNE